MALDTIILDGDEVEFSLPDILVTEKTTIKASGKTTVNGKKVCVQGDEESIEIPNCSYISGPFLNGKGTLTVKKLVPAQLTQKARSGNKPMILRGKPFIAQFKVTTKAMQPPPANTPDPVPFYIGIGKFIPGNEKIKAT